MTVTISVLAAALAALAGLALFAPLAEPRRRGLRAVLFSAAMVAVGALGLFCAAFLALSLSGRESLAPLSMHALMAALAAPLVVGLAAVGFAAMAAMSPAVFDRVNDRFAANLYVLIGVAIVVFCSSSSFKADWPGYVIAAFAVPLVPSLAARRLGRARRSGFGAQAEDASESYRVDRAGQTETRWAEPVIAARPPERLRRAARTASRPAPEPAPRHAQAPRREGARPAAAGSLAPVSPMAVARRAAAKVDLAPVAKEAGRLVGDLRRKAAAAIAPASVPQASAAVSPARPSPARTSVSADRPVPARQTVRDASRDRPSAAQPTSPAASMSARAVQPPPQRRDPVARPAQEPARSAAMQPQRAAAQPIVRSRPAAGMRPAPEAPPARPASRPSLLPPEAEPIRRPASRTLIEPIRQMPALAAAPVPRDPPAYPLTAPFEPGSDRWATLVDGMLTTENGVTRLISARATQAISPGEIEAVVESVSGAA